MSGSIPVSAFAARPASKSSPVAGHNEESLITALEEDLIYDDHGYLPTSDSDDEDLEPTTPKKKRKTTSSTPAPVAWSCCSTWRWTTTSAVRVGRAHTAVVVGERESLCLLGYVEMAVVYGAVEVHGAVLAAGGGAAQYRPLYSPRSTSVISINAADTLAQEMGASKMLFEEGHEAQVAAEIAGVVEANAQRCAAVVVFREPSAAVRDKVAVVTRSKHYRSIFSLAAETPAGADPLQISTARLILAPRSDVRSFQAPPLWVRAAEDIASHPGGSGPPVVLVCGGKDVGKSSFVRYLVNSLLRRSSQVAHLDCDVGQGEFAPPGIVALTLCAEPILGPPAFHLRTPEHSRFYGDTTARRDPAYYLRCVSSLVREYRDRFPDTPLVINTHGWIKGMGLDILHSIAAMAGPTHTIQFLCPAERASHHMAPLTPDAVEAAHARDLFGVLKQGAFARPTGAGRCIALEAVAGSPTPGGYGFRGADYRNMALCSYFDPAALHCYDVPFSSVALGIVHAEVPRSQFLYSINWSIVALVADTDVGGSSPHGNDDDVDAPIPRFSDSPPDADCLGLGFVRHIDTERGSLSIATPLPPKTAQRVTAIVRGALELPQEIEMGGRAPERNGGKKPYTMPALSHGSSALGSSARSSRANLLRRKNG